ncbi:unnamed protein product [Owenia fusiformis]|uniref:Uncharacterized protein n=1 Tax=Owenia fusiformis TaxID=6347 RepID=A0A8S4PWK9_OWEFU|nr:unnamed protein product [Owenia fusiformis]
MASKPVDPFGPTRKARVNFRLNDDIELLKSVLARNPWSDTSRWEAISREISRDDFIVSSRRASERAELLLKSYRAEDRLKRSKSGTEELYDEYKKLMKF